MRILHLIWSLQGGGAERQLTALSQELARRGHDVHVAFVYPGVHSARLAESCTLHHLRRLVKYDASLVVQAGRVVWRTRPGVLHTWLEYTDIIGGANARLFGLPWVLSERSSALAYPRTRLHRIRAALGQTADLIVANSRGGMAYWEG